jgi:hypothetical protein
MVPKSAQGRGQLRQGVGAALFGRPLPVMDIHCFVAEFGAVCTCSCSQHFWHSLAPFT